MHNNIVKQARLNKQQFWNISYTRRTQQSRLIGCLRGFSQTASTMYIYKSTNLFHHDLYCRWNRHQGRSSTPQGSTEFLCKKKVTMFSNRCYTVFFNSTAQMLQVPHTSTNGDIADYALSSCSVVSSFPGLTTTWFEYQGQWNRWLFILKVRFLATNIFRE